jgi:hypothetical protein
MAKADSDVIAFLQENVGWWKDAADSCEAVALTLSPREREEQLLLSAVYRERAELHKKMIEKLRGESSHAD